MVTSRSAVRTAVAAVVLLAFLVVLPTGARAANTVGASFSVNASTHAISVNVKNGPGSAPITRIDVTLPLETEVVGTPSGGGTCTAPNVQTASCTYDPPIAAGAQALVLINSSGARPLSVNVQVDFADGSGGTAAGRECGAVAPGPIPGGTVGAPYTAQLTATGGRAPYTFSSQGVLPPGLSLSPSGRLTGSPTRDGRFAATVIASDADGCLGLRNIVIVIRRPVCRCTRLRGFYDGVTRTDRVVTLKVDWTLECAAGRGGCRGEIEVRSFRAATRTVVDTIPTQRGEVFNAAAVIRCVSSSCKRRKTVQSRVRFTLGAAHSARLRDGRTLIVALRSFCLRPGGRRVLTQRIRLTLAFGRNGRFDRRATDANGDGRRDDGTRRPLGPPA